MNFVEVADKVLERLDTSGNCWIWEGPTAGQSGYPRYGRTYLHRQVLSNKLGIELTSDDYACHTCDNPSCIKPSHIFLGTQQDNIRDMIQKGRAAHQKGTHVVPHPFSRGIDNPAGKLTDADVAEIRSRYENEDVTQQELADEFGVTQGHVSGLINGHEHARRG